MPVANDIVLIKVSKEDNNTKLELKHWNQSVFT